MGVTSRHPLTATLAFNSFRSRQLVSSNETNFSLRQDVQNPACARVAKEMHRGNFTGVQVGKKSMHGLLTSHWAMKNCEHVVGLV